MKKSVCAVFCIMVVSCIFSVTAFAEDYNARAISALQKFRELNDQWSAAFLSGDNAVQKEKGKLLSEHKEGEFTYILKTLPEHYCAAPNLEVLREFMETIIGTSNSGDEYPTYVFAELYACDPDGVIKAILSLKPEDQKVIVENLDYGFKNITYKVKSLPDYEDLVKRLDDLKQLAHDNSKSE